MRRAVLVAGLLGMLIGAGALVVAQAGQSAQAVQPAQVVRPDQVLPVVLSGSEIGFRMVARAGDKAVGQLVVRVDGRWVEAEFAGGVKLVGGK
jgi:hypothetical protein